MAQILAGTTFGQVFSYRLDLPKQKQKITKYGIMKKQKITSIALSKYLDDGLFYSSEKNVYHGSYEDQTQQTIFSNTYNTSKIVGIHSHGESILAALNNGALISTTRDTDGQTWVNEEILGSKFQSTLNKCYKKLIFDGDNSFCMIGKEVLPFLYDSSKKIVSWSGKNVPNDELDLRVPINDVDATFFKNKSSLACANADSKIRVYDVRTNRQRASADYQLKLEKVYTRANLTRIIVSPQNDSTFYVANDLGSIYELDMRKQMQVVCKYKGIVSTVTDLLIHDNQLFASSLDSCVRSFDLQSREINEKFYMNKPIYSIKVKQPENVVVQDEFKQEVLSDEEQNFDEPEQKKIKKLRKRNKVNLKYLKPVNWDEVPIKEELLQQAKEEYEQINSKDADSYFDEENQQNIVKDEHESGEERDSDLD